MTHVQRSLKTAPTGIFHLAVTRVRPGRLFFGGTHNLIASNLTRMPITFGCALLINKAHQQSERNQQVLDGPHTDVVLTYYTGRANLAQPLSSGYCSPGPEGARPRRPL